MTNTSRMCRRTRPLLTSAVAVLATTLVGASLASAQSSAPSAPDDAPRTRTPFWGSDSDGAARDGGRRQHDDRGHGDDKESTFNDDFPTDLAADVPVTKERYTALRAGYRSAVRRLNNHMVDLRRDFEASEAYRTYLSDRDDAQAMLDAARADAMAPLKNDADYQAAGEIQKDLARQIKAAHEATEPDMAKIRGMSELSLKYATQRKAKEQALTQDDPAVLAALDKMKALGRRQADMEAEYDRTARQDEKGDALRQQVDDLRIGYLAAGARYDATVRAADLAADFAYYRAAAQSSRSGSNYGYGGYGYGGYGVGGYAGFGSYDYYPPFTYGGTIYGGFVNLGGGTVTPATPSPLGNSIVGGPGHSITGGPSNTMVPAAGAN